MFWLQTPFFGSCYELLVHPDVCNMFAIHSTALTCVPSAMRCGLRSSLLAFSKPWASGPWGVIMLCRVAPPGLNPSSLASYFPSIRPINSLIQFPGTKRCANFFGICIAQLQRKSFSLLHGSNQFLVRGEKQRGIFQTVRQTTKHVFQSLKIAQKQEIFVLKWRAAFPNLGDPL